MDILHRKEEERCPWFPESYGNVLYRRDLHCKPGGREMEDAGLRLEGWRAGNLL